MGIARFGIELHLFTREIYRTFQKARESIFLYDSQVLHQKLRDNSLSLEERLTLSKAVHAYGTEPIEPFDGRHPHQLFNSLSPIDRRILSQVSLYYQLAQGLNTHKIALSCPFFVVEGCEAQEVAAQMGSPHLGAYANTMRSLYQASLQGTRTPKEVFEDFCTDLIKEEDIRDLSQIQSHPTYHRHKRGICLAQYSLEIRRHYGDFLMGTSGNAAVGSETFSLPSAYFQHDRSLPVFFVYDIDRSFFKVMQDEFPAEFLRTHEHILLGENRTSLRTHLRAIVSIFDTDPSLRGGTPKHFDEPNKFSPSSFKYSI